MRCKSLNNHGYTLIEIVMVIVILGIIGGFTFQMVAYGVEAFKKTSARKDLFDEARLAMERMAREIRDAKELVACSEDTITFKKKHPSQDGVEEIKFWLDGSNTLWRVRNPSTTPLSDRLASNVDSFQVANSNCSTVNTITIDAVNYGTTDGGPSITISHTTSGSDRLMLVGVSVNNDNYETVTSVTYNGTDLTKVGEINNSNDAKTEIWSLVAPDTGTYNVVITFSATLAQEAVAGVVTFNGVNQTTPLGTFASAQTDDSTTATLTIPSDSGELVFGVVSVEYDAVTASSGQTEHWNESVPQTYGAGGTAAGASPNVTMSWDLVVDSPVYNHWSMGGVSIKPTTAYGGGAVPAAASVVSLELTVSSEQGGEVSMRTMVNMRNLPPT